MVIAGSKTDAALNHEGEEVVVSGRNYKKKTHTIMIMLKIVQQLILRNKKFKFNFQNFQNLYFLVSISKNLF